MANIFDEPRIQAFDAPESAKVDVLRVGEEIAESVGGDLDEVQCGAYPPDGIKATLSQSNRKLILYFFGDGRMVFGTRIATNLEHKREGELSLDPMTRAQREDLYRWLIDERAGSQERPADSA